MTKEHDVNQTQWLGEFVRGNNNQFTYTGVGDIQISQGVCHAMTTNWLFARLRDLNWNPANEWWRAVSHQRAYVYVLLDQIRLFQQTRNLHGYINVAQRPTRRYVEDEARRRHMNFAVNQRSGLDAFIDTDARNLTPSSGCVVSFYGTNVSGDLKAHTVGLLRRTDGSYRYLDTNDAEYSWPATVAWATLRQNLYTQLYDKYETIEFWSVTRVDVYRVG